MKTVTLTTSLLLSILLSTSAFASNWMHYDQSNSPLPANHVTSVLSDEDGTWVGTDDGLAFFDGVDWEVYDSETSELPDNYIRDIHKDNSGITWIATDGGLLKVDANGWESLTMSNSNIPSNNIRSVTTDSEGNIWIGTWGQGIAFKDGNNWTVYDTNNSDLPSNGVFTVELDELGVVWVGMFNGGVSKFNGITWETFNTSNSDLPHNHVRTISFDQNHIAWFGTEDGIAKKTPGDQWNIYKAETIGYSFHTVYKGIVESPGVVYFGTDGGILQFVNSTFSMVTSQNSNLPSNNIRSMALDGDGNVWVGSGNDGLSIYSAQGTLNVKQPLKGGEFPVYPNPSVGEITFHLPSKNTKNTDIVVFNGIGQAVIQKQLVNSGIVQQTLDVSSLPLGTYFLSVRSSDGMAQSRFQKL